MLVLTRRVGETVKIGESITVTITNVHGGQVRLGINAPKDVNIIRTELIPKMEAQGKEVYTQKPGRSEGSIQGKTHTVTNRSGDEKQSQ